MAVYTQLGAEALTELIAEFGVGALVSAKGIAEGVSNSNWLIETDGRGASPTRFILTMYEARTDLADLPFFLSLMDHLSEKQCPVPRTVHDRDGAAFRMVGDKAVALIEFLPGVSPDQPNAKQAYSVGRALAQLHLAVADFSGTRTNSLGSEAWHSIADDLGAERLSQIDPSLPDIVFDELAWLSAHWPQDLPKSVIHADLFPDNVLMRGNEVGGLIDFYFACHDITAYDLAVTHAAWCFDASGRDFYPELSAALLDGYASVRSLSAEEKEVLPLLARGAALRFVLTRADDWLNTPAGAIVARKDPMAFVHRNRFYADPDNAKVFQNIS